MVLAHEDSGSDESADASASECHSPFWFARVLGVYHANVLHTGPKAKVQGSQMMHFLWVRWLGACQDDDMRSGWSNRRLPLVGFVPEGDISAFGFLDPREVVRGVHLIPAFHYGRTTALLQPSIARAPDDHDQDWRFFYVGR